MTSHAKSSSVWPAKKLEVLCLGLPRCATTSLHHVLELPVLGLGPSLHMFQVFSQPHMTRLVTAAMRERSGTARRQELVGRLMEGYASTTDLPGIFFADDLMDMYPDAAIVLNARPGPKVQRATSWARSIADTLAAFASPWYFISCFWIPNCRAHYSMYMEIDRVFAKVGLIDGARDGGLVPGTKWMQPDFYDRYNDWIRAEAKKRGRKVLEFEPGMGWTPLCEFIGKPDAAPAAGTPFPKMNDTRSLRKKQRIVFGIGALGSVVILYLTYMAVSYAPSSFRLVRQTVGRLRSS